MNSISISGRLTKDAEKKTVGDNVVTSFSLATDVFVKGEKQAMFWDCSVWGKRADTAAQYLKKGGAITVIGRLMPVYVSGEKAYLKVDVTDFSLPPRAAGGDDQGQASPPPARRAAPPADDGGIPF